MSMNEDDDLDEELASEEQASPEPRRGGSSGNRNFLLALGILGGLFVLVTIVLVLLYLSRPRAASTSNISATNAAIQTANAKTAVAATLTSSFKKLATNTPVPPTFTATVPKPTATSVLAQPTATVKGATQAPAKGLASPTANAQTQTRSAPAALTQAAQQTQTRQASINLTATATALPKTGLAEDIGLPGLFGLAIGLIVVIFLVRRLRLTAS